MNLTEVLPADLTAPARARALVAECVGSSSVGRVALQQDALQVVSELTANAVLHGEPPYQLQVSAQPDSVRIEITQNQGREPGTYPKIRADRLGLQLVAALSQSWGSTTARGDSHGQVVRQTVWAQIDNSTSSGTSPTRLGSPSQG